MPLEAMGIVQPTVCLSSRGINLQYVFRDSTKLIFHFASGSNEPRTCLCAYCYTPAQRSILDSFTLLLTIVRWTYRLPFEAINLLLAISKKRTWYFPLETMNLVCNLDMMTSSNGKVFGVTGPLCQEFSVCLYRMSSFPWWRHQMETFSALLALCAGNSPAIGEFSAQMPVRRAFDVFFDLRLNKRLSKHSWGWWFEPPSRSLWRHGNGNVCGYLSYFTDSNCRRFWPWPDT